MFAPPLCRRFLPSWSARCGRAGIVVAVLLVPALRTAAQETAPAHHPHHTHGKVSHHHGAAAHPPSRQVPHPKPATPVPESAPAPAPAPPAPSVAPAPIPANKGSNTGLPLPRFAALRADEVNMRSGPGTRYPILWLYKRRDLPVRIEREFDVWRLVEDSDGVKGWVHQATLVGTRTFVVTASAETSIGSTDRGSGVLLRDDPRDDAGVVAILRPGVIGRLRDCPSGSGWCRVTTHNYSGWLQRSAIFGLLPNEVITPP
jgi:SH3-like domain-containing protein